MVAREAATQLAWALNVPEKKTAPRRVLNRCMSSRLPPTAAMGKPFAIALPMVVRSGVTPQMA